MSCCRCRERKSASSGNINKFLNGYKSAAKLFREEYHRKPKVNFLPSRKKSSSNGISVDKHPHHSDTSDDSEESENFCENLPQSGKSASCRINSKNKNSSVGSENQLNCNHSSCKNCSTITKCGCHTKNIDNSEKGARLKCSSFHSKHCRNNTNVTKNASLSKNSSQANCKNCHNNSNIKETDSEVEKSVPQAESNCCQNDTKKSARNRRSKCSVSHTDCKYCQNNTNNFKTKSSLPHTDCKYCLDDANNPHQFTSKSSGENTISMEEDLLDEIPNMYPASNYRYVPCSFHDPYVMMDPSCLYPPLSYCQMYHKKPYACKICEYPSFCLVNDDLTADIRELTTDPSSRFFREPFTQDGYRGSPRLDNFNVHHDYLKYNHNFKPHRRSSSANITRPSTPVSCQFCLTTGKPPLIYNSHSLRDEVGLKCPILKEHLATGNVSHICNTCKGNSVEEVPHLSFMKCSTNCLLSKQQYLNLTDYLM